MPRYFPTVLYCIIIIMLFFLMKYFKIGNANENLDTHTYIYTCIYTHTYIHTHIYTHIYTYIHIYIYIYTHIYLFNCTHIRTTLSPLDLWTDPAGVTALLTRWTVKLAGGPQAETSDSPPLARVMGVGRQQQRIRLIPPPPSC